MDPLGSLEEYQQALSVECSWVTSRRFIVDSAAVSRPLASQRGRLVIRFGSRELPAVLEFRSQHHLQSLESLQVLGHPSYVFGIQRQNPEAESSSAGNPLKAVDSLRLSAADAGSDELNRARHGQ